MFSFVWASTHTNREYIVCVKNVRKAMSKIGKIPCCHHQHHCYFLLLFHLRCGDETWRCSMFILNLMGDHDIQYNMFFFCFLFHWFVCSLARFFFQFWLFICWREKFDPCLVDRRGLVAAHRMKTWYVIWTVGSSGSRNSSNRHWRTLPVFSIFIVGWLAVQHRLCV